MTNSLSPIITSNFTSLIFSSSQSNITTQSDITDSEKIIIVYLSFILSGLSILSCLIVVILYLRFKSLRTFMLEPVVLLCFCEAFNHAAVYLPSDNKDNPKNIICKIQGFIGNFFDVASLIWTAIITYSSIISIVEQKHVANNQNTYRIIFISISIVVPGVLSLV